MTPRRALAALVAVRITSERGIHYDLNPANPILDNTP
jgi:hypothetical protein